jgi:hypothetical protein
MMKKLLLTAVIISSVLFMGCDKAKVDVHFDLNIANVYFTIDTTSVTGDVQLSSTTFTSTLQQELESHDANLDDVKSITVTGVEFTHLNPQNFDILDKAYAYLSVPGQPEQRIAYKDPVPVGVTVLPMDVDAVNLKNYLAQPVVTFNVTGHLNAPNAEADSIQAHLTFKVEASVKPN